MTYKAIPVDEFWELVANGFTPEPRAFIIRKDGAQDWRYVLKWQDRYIFDSYKQGLSMKDSDIEFVLVPENIL